MGRVCYCCAGAQKPFVNMQKIKHIHFVGIKGVGVAPLAIIAHEAGFIVTGSDIADAFITDEVLAKSDITPFVGFDPKHVDGADLVVTTGAHGGFDNPEVLFAKERQIPVWTQGEAVGKFMTGEIFQRKTLGISVGGTHGKTTTTAMIAHVLSHAQQDPSWVVGTSRIGSLGLAGHFGKGTYFVAEADEYANEPLHDKTPKMLLQHPKIAVITNIEHDHPDLYPSIDSVREAFSRFAKLLPPDGVLIACGDDMQVQKLLANYHQTVLTYGFEKSNTYHIQNVTKNTEGTAWEVRKEGEIYALSLSVSGEHNILNATAAFLVGKMCGIAGDDMKKSLHAFTGTKRRMEYIGQLASGALLYDDYAHHPTEITKTLKAIREKYPNSHIVCIFQPHTFSRTKLLFDQFIDSLSLADEIVLADIYSSQREAFDTSVSSAMLVDKIKEKKPAFLAKRLSDVVKYVNTKAYGTDVVVLTMGAGDIYQVANELLEHESAPRVS